MPTRNYNARSTDSNQISGIDIFVNDQISIAKTLVRADIKSSVDSLQRLIESRTSAIEQTVAGISALIAASADKAQTANDALYKLLEAEISGLVETARMRFDAGQVAITKAEAAAAAVDVKAQTANDTLERLVTANHTASLAMTNLQFDALHAASGKSETAIQVRAVTVQSAMTAIEEKMNNRVTSLQGMIELRSEMSQTAIIKAEQANEQRLASVNAFRETLTDQARSFVTSSVMDARFAQIQQQHESLERIMRAANESLLSSIASHTAQLAGISSRLAVGGGAITVMFLAIQLVLNLLHHGP